MDVGVKSGSIPKVRDLAQDHVKRQTRFVSDKPAKEIISKMESTGQLMGFRVETHKYKVIYCVVPRLGLFMFCACGR